MGYDTGTGRSIHRMDLDMSPAAAVTADANGTAVLIGDRGTVRLTLEVSDVDGTNPTLDVDIETSEDGSDWRVLGSFAQLDDDGSERKSFGGADRYIRAVYDIGGTDNPTFTVSLTGEAL